MTCSGRFMLGCVLPLALLAIAGCGRAGGASGERISDDAGVARLDTSETDDAPLPLPSFGDKYDRLERLRAQGRFEEFIDGALNAGDEHPDDAALQLQTGEALLASGRARECEDAALRAAALARDNGAIELSLAALRLWVTARYRQSKSLDDPAFDDLLAKLPPGDQGLQILAFWRQAIGTRTPYRTSASSETVEMEMAEAASGSIPFELNAIQARANGAPMPLVFIDTGAQHTLMTVAAARAAGVSVGSADTQLMGFKGLVAAPGVIETLELGDLVLFDVPVLVGDSVPLVALDGQISLGTELMHHVRFRIDYPGHRVTAQGANARSPRPARPSICDIPVWTFSQICLARGQLPTGSMARVLVDTGDSAGTFVSYRWARRNMPDLRGAGTPMVFRLKKRNMSLEMLEIGSLSLSTWPVEDTIPKELDRLNRVDVILGHDLLWPYQLTIDLPARMLQLHSGTSPAAAADRNDKAE